MGAVSYVCRSYRGETRKPVRSLLVPPFILNRVKRWNNLRCNFPALLFFFTLKILSKIAFSIEERSFENLYSVFAFFFSSVSIAQFNPLSANFTKWSNTVKEFVRKLPTNCLSVFDHFVGLAIQEFSFKLLLVSRC